MEKSELLYDHYKDSYSLIKNAEIERNRLFVHLAILVTVLFLISIDPNNSNTLFSIIESKFDIEFGLSINIIKTCLWLVILYYTLRYYQTNAYIERQYKYIHTLEEMIQMDINSKFDREGINYTYNFPAFLNLVYFIYSWIIPVFYLIIVIVKIIFEFIYCTKWYIVIPNFIIASIIVMLTLYYLIFLHKKTDVS